MKKIISTIGITLFLSVFLAACNTETAEPTVTEADEQQPVTNEEQPDSASASENPVEQQPEETETTDNSENTEATALTYMSNGQPFSEETVTAKSEELGYTIQHFENFSLVAEEPGVDSLLYNEDDAFSMQIEVIQKDETTFDQITASAQETMSAIASEELKELDLSAISTNREEIRNIVAYETMFGEEKVVKVAFERDNLFAVLTIYDTPQKDLTDAFVQMGLTIQ